MLPNWRSSSSRRSRLSHLYGEQHKYAGGGEGKRGRAEEEEEEAGAGGGEMDGGKMAEKQIAAGYILS